MNFQEIWGGFYGDHAPIAYLLRDRSDIWLRVHSLPDSKRYALNEVEYGEILRRANTVAGVVLGEGSNCLLFFPDFAIPILPQFFNTLDSYVFENYDGENAPRVTQYVTATTWQVNKFDDLLRKIADDEIEYVSWMNLETGEVFAPYDGGADLFLDSRKRRDELRQLWLDWLPQNPEGL